MNNARYGYHDHIQLSPYSQASETGEIFRGIHAGYVRTCFLRNWTIANFSAHGFDPIFLTKAALREPEDEQAALMLNSLKPRLGLGTLAGGIARVER